MFSALGKATPVIKPSWLTKMQFSGDSTTADNNTPGNRSGFKQLFVASIYALYNYVMNNHADIVGIQNSNDARSSVPFCGASAQRTDQLLSTYVGTGSGDGLNADLHKPLRVVLLIGFNDLLQDYLNSRTAPHSHVTDKIGEIIDAYKVANPLVQVLVCNLWDNSAQPAAFASCAPAITSYIEGRDDYGVNSFNFDSFTLMGAYDAAKWADTTHLNNAGNIIFNAGLVARMRTLFET